MSAGPRLARRTDVAAFASPWWERAGGQLGIDFHAAGHRPVVALIGCSARKLAQPAAAQELYVGNLFRAARRCVQANGWSWAILSALHGLVQPDQRLVPYDTCVGSGRRQQRAWGGRVARQLRESYWSGARLIVLAGRAYTAFWSIDHDLRFCGFTAVMPLAGLGIGEQLAMLSRPASLRAAIGATSVTDVVATPGW